MCVESSKGLDWIPCQHSSSAGFAVIKCAEWKNSHLFCKFSELPKSFTRVVVFICVSELVFCWFNGFLNSLTDLCGFLLNIMYILVWIVTNKELYSIFYIFQRCGSSDLEGWYSTGTSNFALLGRLFRSNKRWQLHNSSSFSSDTFDEITPETLWEVQLIITLYGIFKDNC